MEPDHQSADRIESTTRPTRRQRGCLNYSSSVHLLTIPCPSTLMSPGQIGWTYREVCRKDARHFDLVKIYEDAHRIFHNLQGCSVSENWMEVGFLPAMNSSDSDCQGS
ncbi:hypothetical protein BaRGS_00001408 [Batillaria attramentaria]|uniref:Uncharacterized protein n=1 Tax=Batillaria attramentaria TaxID=370345 RepID=A0ABD0M6T1_9CAEN